MVGMLLFLGVGVAFYVSYIQHMWGHIDHNDKFYVGRQRF